MRIILQGYALCILWLVFISILQVYVFGYPDVEYSINQSWPYIIFFYVIWAPLWEEALYRYAPLTIAKHLGPQFITPVAIGSSCIFGWGHTNSAEGVLLQGVLGFILSWVYLKSRFSYISSVITHALYNTTVLFI